MAPKLGGMRRARIKIPPEEAEAAYHCFDRVVGCAFLLKDAEKEMLCRMILVVADFCGVLVHAYTAMSNHFHVLVRVPKKRPVSDAELLRRWRVLHPNPTAYERIHIERIEQQMPLDTPLVIDWRERQLAMMGDVSEYMKMLKQRYTIWFNQRHERRGTLWCERFGDTLVEVEGRGLRAVAAYIDLNCVRARLVRDPKDYRFSSYGQAVAGSEVARRGIAGVLGEGPWEETQREYRVLLFTTGSEEREKGGFISQEDLQKVLQEGGKLALATVLRCRVRYFSRGAVLGSTAFVEKQLERLRQRMPCPRTRCRPLPGVTDWGELAVLCRMRGSGLAPPAHEGA